MNVDQRVMTVWMWKKVYELKVCKPYIEIELFLSCLQNFLIKIVAWSFEQLQLFLFKVISQEIFCEIQ